MDVSHNRRFYAPSFGATDGRGSFNDERAQDEVVMVGPWYMLADLDRPKEVPVLGNARTDFLGALEAIRRDLAAKCDGDMMMVCKRNPVFHKQLV
jgi:hypothetical protein